MAMQRLMGIALVRKTKGEEDGCGRAARRDAAGVARGRCRAGEEGASQGGERQEEAPGREELQRPASPEPSALCLRAGSQPRGPVGSAGHQRRLRLQEQPAGCGLSGACRRPGLCAELALRPRCHQPPLLPVPRPLLGALCPVAAVGGGGGEGGGIAERAGLSTAPRAPPRPCAHSLAGELLSDEESEGGPRVTARRRQSREAASVRVSPARRAPSGALSRPRHGFDDHLHPVHRRVSALRGARKVSVPAWHLLPRTPVSLVGRGSPEAEAG
ncbi:hypothetical protein NN561_001679 [Cricetulus griseus]